MFKRFTKAITILSVSALLLTGCGSSSSNSFSAAATESFAASDTAAGASFATKRIANSYDSGDYNTVEEMEEYDSIELPEEPSINATAKENRKLITTVNMNMETKQFDSVYNDMLLKIDNLGGWVESNSVSQSGYSWNGEEEDYLNRTAFITARIPADKLDTFLNYVDTNTKVTYKNASTTDVTLQYTDTEARIRSLRTEEDKLTEFLEQAETVEDLISIQDRLSSVQYQLDSAQSSLNVLKSQVEVSSVTMQLDEVREYTEPEPESYFVRIFKGFGENLKETFTWLTDLIAWIVIHIPSLILTAIIVFCLFKLLKMVIKTGDKKRIKESKRIEKKEKETE